MPSSSDRDPLIERLLERSVRAVSGGGLHPLEIISAVEHACLEAVADSTLPNQVTVGFNESDFKSFRGALSDLRWEIDRMLERIERQYGYHRQGDRAVIFEPADGTAPGNVRVTARFADVVHRPQQPAPRVVTQAVQVQHKTTLVMDDGRRMPLTHTPFTIGRAAGNDIVLVSLAVSRHHAQVVDTEDGLVMEDMGSTNGISANGIRRERILLKAGVPVQVGDVKIWVERAS
jgi:hypothetical protein